VKATPGQLQSTPAASAATDANLAEERKAEHAGQAEDGGVSTAITEFELFFAVELRAVQETMSQVAAMVPDPALHGFLNPSDGVAISFWIISISMVAATVFFLMESMNVGYHWKTSLNVGALVTLVAAVHYFYMREFWIQIGSSPMLYRYIDWSITVPLQMVEFYFILVAVNPNIGAGMFFRLLLGTVAMLAFGYSGENGSFNPWAAFACGMAGWAFILQEIFIGEAAKEAGNLQSYVKSSYDIMKFIVSVGWSIYPLGYFFGFLMFQHKDDSALNLIYNLADFVNKIAFCLAIWSCAKQDTAEKKGKAALLA